MPQRPRPGARSARQGTTESQTALPKEHRTMWFLPSLRAFLPDSRPSPRSRQRGPTTVLTLEPLEDRCLLSFGTGGMVTTPIGPSGAAEATAGLVRPDGKIIAAGEVFLATQDSDFGV